MVLIQRHAKVQVCGAACNSLNYCRPEYYRRLRPIHTKLTPIHSTGRVQNDINVHAQVCSAIQVLSAHCLCSRSRLAVLD